MHRKWSRPPPDCSQSPSLKVKLSQCTVDESTVIMKKYFKKPATNLTKLKSSEYE
jgi:hypothetical protein